MNKKGFAISVILYSLVFLLVAIFYLLLGIEKTRYSVGTKLRKDIVEELNDSGGLYDKIIRLCDNNNISYVSKYNTANGIAVDTPSGTGGKDVCYYTTTSTDRNNDADRNGNVIFGDYCWQIVRTTSDGGVKLIYNGLKTDDNKCTSDAVSSYSSNPRPTSQGFVGSAGTTVNLAGNKLYGTGFTYNGTTFTLTNTFTANWAGDYDSDGVADYLKLMGTYTCKNTSSTCTTLYYVGQYYDANTAGTATYTIGTLNHYSQIGKSTYNAYQYGMVLAGYMYNEIPRFYSTNITVPTDMITRTSISTSTAYFYGNSVVWDGTQYNLLWDGASPTATKTWSSIRSTAGGKYTCKSKTAKACDTVYYIVANSSNTYMYNVPLSNNENINTKAVTWKYSTTYSKSGSNYTLTSPQTLTIYLKDWYANYSGAAYKNIYVCPDFTSTTCTDLGYMTANNNYQARYDLLSNNYTFGYSTTYNSGYTIDTNSDTNKYKTFWDWYQKYNTINSSHYTCFGTSGNSCGSSIKYIFYTAADAAYYINLTGGDKIDTALNKMINTSNANTTSINKYDSAIKGLIDNWYKKNIDDKGLSVYLDNDAVFCNDRTVKNLYGWSPTGSTTSYFQFGSYTVPSKTNASLNCTNVTDRFSANNTYASLTYPVGLLSMQEMLMMYTGYTKTGQTWWVSTPYNISTMTINSRYVLATGATGTTGIHTSAGVRPVIVLKPNTAIISGNGTYERPYIIDTGN